MDIQTIIRDIFNENKEVYSTIEVAKKLGISPKTIINQINSGNLIAFRIGKLYKIAKYNLIEFLENNVLEKE
ncbi:MULTISPECIES: helix-turn-helix domain-containing protein [Fusobacterium]|jgi:DNA binding domain, excisionase family|uniref:DNA-binding protein n=1 Tax=Fusobacterium nucleatum subsp. polymorphum TaxID=76857 RepID=A0A241Q1T1_FUSNP|nr:MULTISPECIES: helix-turn-helix domain-containing protein [Fusobacterium]ASG28773.1 DNA-binding protein [Fusobacterium polymorphum]